MRKTKSSAATCGVANPVSVPINHIKKIDGNLHACTSARDNRNFKWRVSFRSTHSLTSLPTLSLYPLKSVIPGRQYCRVNASAYSWPRPSA